MATSCTTCPSGGYTVLDSADVTEQVAVGALHTLGGPVLVECMSGPVVSTVSSLGPVTAEHKMALFTMTLLSQCAEIPQ